MQWLRRRAVWLIWLPPIGAVAMGILMLNLALATDPGYVESAVPPLSKTSWRGEGEAANSALGATRRTGSTGAIDAKVTEQAGPESTIAVAQ